VLDVAHLAEGGFAIHVNLPDLPRRELEEGSIFLPRHQLRRGSRAPTELPPFALRKLDIVNHRPEWNDPERQGIPHADLSLGAGHYLRADLKSTGSQDVTLLTIRVVQKSNSR
jgi:hypothetical protein